MASMPGDEAQVDFGGGAPTVKVDGTENIYYVSGRIEETRRWADVEIHTVGIADGEGYLIGRKSIGWTCAYSEPN